MIKTLGADDDGNLNYDLFQKSMTEKMGSDTTKEEVMEVFRPYDKEQTGKVSEETLRKIIKILLGENLKDEELDEIIKVDAKVDADDMVEYEQFVETLITNSK